MEESINVSGNADTSTAMYFNLKLNNIVASNLPEQKKTSHRRVLSRNVRMQCNLDNTKYSLEWKDHAKKISWLDVLSYNAHKTSVVSFDVYSKYSHGEDQLILKSEPVTAGFIISLQNEKGVCMIGLNLKDDSGNTYTNPSSATVSFTLVETPVEQGLMAVKEALVSKIDTRERWSNLVAPLQHMIKFCAEIAEVETHAKIALACVKVACDVFVKPFDLDDKVLKLMDEIDASLFLVLEVDSESGAHVLTKNQRKILPDLMHQINECILFVHEYSSQSYFATVAKAIVKKYDSIISEYVEALRNAKERFRDSELRDIQVVVHRLEGQVKGIEHGVSILKLGQLRITEGAGRDPAKMCLKGTRISVLDKIRMWIHGGGGPGADAQMLLIIGQAGVGKSAIAHSIANEYAKLDRLGAVFCFSKDRGSINFFRTLARSLADMDPLYASELASSITSEKETSTSLDVQMQEVFLPPFKHLSALGPIVIVIDALDECVDRKPLIDCLIRNISSIPANIRIIMTSRPAEASELRGQLWVKELDLKDEPAEQEDILLYVKKRLGKRLKSEVSGTTSHGLKEADLEDIALHSEGLFQFASVVCSEILSSYSYEWPSGEPETPKQTFTRLVKGRKGGLDTLYSGLLEKLYPNTKANSQGLQDFRRIMGWILVAQHLLTHDTLVDFGQLLSNSDPNDQGGYNRVTMMLRPLSALLSGTEERSSTVYPLHSSIRNYLTDENRSGRFYIGSEAEQHMSLASILLRLLVAPGRLRFNMANLETSYFENRKVPDFEARVSAAVSASLSYACRYWATHLRKSLQSPAHFEGLKDIGTLMNQKFLFWLEVLALQRKTSFAEDVCQMLIIWLTKTPTLSTVSLDRLDLCLRFVRDYSNIIQSATPHLYLSALAQTPEILDTTLHRFTALPKVVRTPGNDMDESDVPCPTYMTLYGHTGEIYLLEFSPDGQYIVTASRDKTLRIWDTQTCSQVGDPVVLTGHRGPILSACFSPDGTLVVSTSYDETVCIWNAQSKVHEQLGESFTGHIDVEKALFFPNGKHVISASEDTILFWDAATHAQIAEPLIFHHHESIFAVSPDGNCIALQTEDDDGTLEILSIQTGARIGQLLAGHRNSVWAVAFSPDGQHIVTSADGDHTLRIWDAKTGALIDVIDRLDLDVIRVSFFPDGRHIMTDTRVNYTNNDTRTHFWDLKTHSQIRQDLSMLINGFSAFSSLSPNGDQVASVSPDYLSVRIWSSKPRVDTRTRTRAQARAQSFKLKLASYSPAGQSIITCGTDNNVRVWEAEMYSQIGKPLTEHSGKFNSASFSSDGQLIVTGSSDDKTVRIWSVETGVQVGDPLTGHITEVVSVAFSPDGTCFISADEGSIRVWSARQSDLGKLIQVIKIHLSQPEDQIQSISFSPWGQLLGVNIETFSGGRYTRILDLKTGDEASISPLRYQHSSVCFSPDEHLILFFGHAELTHHWLRESSSDHNLYLWSVESSSIQRTFSGHKDTVLRACFSSDGKHVVSASLDSTIRVWHTETGSQAAMYLTLGWYHHPYYLKTIEVSPDGKRILSVYYGYDNDYDDHHTQIWAMPDSLPPGTNVNYSIENLNPWLRADTPSRGIASLRGWEDYNPQGTGKAEILFCTAKEVDVCSLMWLPCHVGVLNPASPPMHILWEDSVHGTEWTKCYLGEGS